MGNWARGRAQRRAKVGFQNPSPSAPPSALTPVAVQLRLVVAGARRAIPRRIHGVRLAITSTARSERRIAVRGPGVGVDASSRLGRSRPRAVAIDRQELPGAGHATQLDAAAVLEARARADDQVPDGAVDEDFAGPGLAEDPRRDVYGDPPDVGVEQFALAGVDAGADLDAQCLGVDRARPRRSGWPASGRRT